MRSLILGTAGHIDHGKTALVRALTGVDTDRLKEEKERGITIDLGFAELAGDEIRLGVVDVPGHEGFVRNMLAGATGMDVVLLVVAADEGVMPQTREHLAIVRLLGVDRLVVALTKTDLVEPEWLELVREEVRETLEDTPYAEAPVVPTSARTGRGVDELRTLLLETALGAGAPEADDMAVLPVDRVFTVRGTGTVVTGTLWSGRLAVGERVRLVPGELPGRVRGLQVHGEDVDAAEAGSRVAVALAGEVMDREHVTRGQTLTTHETWPESRMLTVRFRLLEDTPWELAHNQRVRVHLGTAEVMARAVVFGDQPLRAGETGWGQLRLESPAAARARQALVLRSYSPVTTIGGAVVAETHPPKRHRAEAELVEGLRATVQDGAAEVVTAVLERAGWAGVSRSLMPVASGFAPGVVDGILVTLLAEGAIQTPQERIVGPATAHEVRRILLDQVEALHESEPFRQGMPVEELRDVLPGDAAAGLADAVLEQLVGEGRLQMDRGVVARSGFEPRLTPDQSALRDEIARAYRDAGLEAPSVDDLPAAMRGDPAFWSLLRDLEDAGVLVPLDGRLWISAAALSAATEAVKSELGGREGLGPADFKSVIPVSRRYLLPILAYFDRTGVTQRGGEGRAVPRT